VVNVVRWLKKKEELVSEKKNDVVAEEVKLSPPTKPETKIVKKESVQERYEIGSIATQTSEVIINTETGEHLDVLTALVLILNKIDKIEDTING
jgi:hypothetical protein